MGDGEQEGLCSSGVGERVANDGAAAGKVWWEEHLPHAFWLSAV